MIGKENWWSDNTVNSHYIKFTFIQPGNWNGSDDIETYANGIHKTGSRYIPRRPMGYGACKGQDIVGTKRYELSNHLGNVLAVITDRKWAVDKGVFDLNTGLQTSSVADGNPDYYQTEVVAYNDYYPYGMQMPDRHGSEGEYRYGFQGQEKDDEVAGKGNSYTAQFWQYDSRLGRRWNIDPVVKVHESPYAAFANNPIWFIDPSGADSLKVTSSSLNDKGEELKKGDTPLFLFMAYTENKTGENGTDATLTMTMSGYANEYQNILESMGMTLNGKDVTLKKYAKFVYANDNTELLKKSVNVTSMSSLSEFMNKGDGFAGSTGLMGCYECSLDRNWNHGKVMDYKSKAANDMGFTYIEGVGFYSSDFIGNLVYGWAWGGYDNSLATFLGTGDFLSNDMKFQVGGNLLTIDAVDDIYDGYAIALGWKMRQTYSTATEGLQNMNGIIDVFSKWSTHGSFLMDDWSTNKYYMVLKNGKSNLYKVSVD